MLGELSSEEEGELQSSFPLNYTNIEIDAKADESKLSTELISRIAPSGVPPTINYSYTKSVNEQTTEHENFTFHHLHGSTVNSATEEVFTFHPLLTTARHNSGNDLVTEATVQTSSSTRKIEIATSTLFESRTEASTFTDFFSENPKNVLLTSTEAPISTIVSSQTDNESINQQTTVKALLDLNDVEFKETNDEKKNSTVKHDDDQSVENSGNELNESPSDNVHSLTPPIISVLQTTSSTQSNSISAASPSPNLGKDDYENKQSTVSVAQKDSSGTEKENGLQIDFDLMEDRNDSESSNISRPTRLHDFFFHSLISVLKANESRDREFNKTLQAEIEKREHFVGLPGDLVLSTSHLYDFISTVRGATLRNLIRTLFCCTVTIYQNIFIFANTSH